MALPETMTKKTSLIDMGVGDYIECEYVGTSTAIGTFSNLGKATKAEIPTTGNTAPTTPNGKFNFICVKRKNGKGGLLIADRNIHDITPDILKSSSHLHGIENPSSLKWEDGGVANGLNYSVSAHAQFGQNGSAAVEFNNELYATWQEGSQIRVKKYNGTTWVMADGNTAYGLNYNVVNAGYEPILYVFKNVLYVSWFENNGTAYQLRIKKLNEDGTWSLADGGALNSQLNYDATKHVTYHIATEYNNELYMFFLEQDASGMAQIRAKKTSDGVTWVTADNNTSLNFIIGRNAYFLGSAVVLDNKLYLSWSEQNANSLHYNIRIKIYDGTNWTLAGQSGGSGGIGVSPLSYHTYSSKMIVFRGELYLAFCEYVSSKYQLRIKKYDTAALTWSFVDNNLALNEPTTSSTDYPNMIVYANELYIIYLSIDQVRIKKYNGLNWVYADGGSTLSLNYLSTRAGYVPFPVIFKSSIFVLWGELNISNIYQMRAKALSVIPGLIRCPSIGLWIADNDKNPYMIYTWVDLYGGYPANNEWDMYIKNSTLYGKVTKNDPTIWNHSLMYTIGREMCPELAIGSYNNTYISLRTLASYTYNSTAGTGGFRPVLEFAEDGTIFY